MKTLLTVPIQATEIDQIEQQLRKELPEVGVFEIWIDSLKKNDLTPEKIRESVRKWKKMTKKKLLVVCKDSTEKGSFRGNQQEKMELLQTAIGSGVDYVDVGLSAGKKWIEKLMKGKKKTTIILSFHHFEKTPSQKQLVALTRKMQALGADIIKIATFVESLEDNQKLMQLALQLQSEKKRHIILGMGEKGTITRILGQKLGNELHFVSLDSKTAPGQLTLDQAIAFQKVLS